jgi:hypothetical protein
MRKLNDRPESNEQTVTATKESEKARIRVRSQVRAGFFGPN